MPSPLSSLAALAVALSAAADEGDGPRHLTLEQASGRAPAPSYSARAESARWAHDGIHVELGRGDEARWIHPETLEERKPAPEPEAAESPDAGPDRDAVAAALANLDGVDAERAQSIARGGRRSGDGAVRLFPEDDGLFFYARTADGAERVGRVPKAEGPFELLDVSDDGRVAAWVADNDLRVLDTVTGALLEVTDDGSDERFNGKLDWVYQEELYGRGDFKAFWLSPDAGHVAFLSLDEEPVHEFTVVDHIVEDTFRVGPEVTNYPKAGDPNPVVRLGIARTTDGHTTWVDLAPYAADEPLVVRVSWTPDGRCLYMVQDRIQTWCDVNVADPESGESRTLFREVSSTWVERPAPPRWLADGTFLWESARTGFDHLYHYAADGTLIRPVTAGEWRMRGVTEVDEEARTVSFTATEGGAVNVNHYRIGLDGTGLVRLTRGPGSHSIDLRPDGRFLLDRVSSLEHPEEVRLCDGKGDLIRVLAKGEVEAEQEGYPLARWEVHQVPARDGELLDAALLKPVPFDPTRPHPVWLSTYSGPDAPTVRNRWSGSAWDQFLAQNGVVQLRVNVRSASGRGMRYTGACYRQLGVPELSDLVDAVDWLTAEPWADASRVGLTGYSYGGFMTAYALLASDRFALGIAGGGVYDWGMYDTIYTERYMSTPQDNPEGYARTSCLQRAADLHGFLHMHHGVMDDNVHVQNMMQLAYRLQKAGRTNWSMMAYPQNRHGIRDGDQRWHSRQVEWALIQEHLHPETAAARARAEAEAAFDATVGAAAGG